MAKRLNNESSIADVLKEIIQVNKLQPGMDQISVKEAWVSLMGNGVNSYTKNVALYMRACLRYINCYFTLYTVGTDLDEKILDLLKMLEIINELSINFIIPISFRIELQYLFALYNKY